MSEYLGIDMRRLYLLLFFFSFSGILFGATTYTSTTTGGDWSVGSTWVGGSVPGTNNTTITIDGSVYSTTSLTFNSNVDLTVNSNDTLIINGDLSLNSNNTFTIQTGAVVIVRGNFTSNSNLNIAADAYFIITGNVTLNNNSTITSASTPSQIFVGGTADWGGHVSGNATDCPAGGTSYNTGCNYGDVIDLINDPISSVVNESCTPQPGFYSSGNPTSNSIVSTGNTINLSANPDPGTASYTYYWTGPNFSYSSTSTANTSISSATTSMTGYYTFYDINSAGCYSKDSTYVLVSDCGTGS